MCRNLAIAALFMAACASLPGAALAQELYEDLQGVWRAEAIQIVEEREEELPWSETKIRVQVVRAKILEGEREGEIVQFQNDYIVLEKGDTFFLNHMVTPDGDVIYSVRDIERTGYLAFFATLFAAVIILFGGKQGVRSLLSLAGSLLVVVYVLIPALLKGYPPVLVSTGIAALVLFVAIFFTHGFNRRSLVAFAGTIISVIATGALAYAAVSLTRLSGFGTDESVYLNLNTAGRLDFAGLLLGGIIIGILGVLDDVAITQVAVVRELKGTGAKLGRLDLYRRAVSVGREHVSALVNTLVLAYTGAALPLLLLLYVSSSEPTQLLNQESFASEVIRTIVGSIGLVLTVPITTILAVVWIDGEKAEKSAHFGHIHSASH